MSIDWDFMIRIWLYTVVVCGVTAGFVWLYLSSLHSQHKIETEKEPKLKPVRTISEAELAEMFLHAPDSPAWKATLAVLDGEVQEGLERCLDERLSNEQIRYRLGIVEGLLEFKKVLEDREGEARRRAEDGGQRTE